MPPRQEHFCTSEGPVSLDDIIRKGDTTSSSSDRIGVLWVGWGMHHLLRQSTDTGPQPVSMLSEVVTPLPNLEPVWLIHANDLSRSPQRLTWTTITPSYGDLTYFDQGEWQLDLMGPMCIRRKQTWNCFRFSEDGRTVEIALDYARTRLTKVDTDKFIREKMWSYSWREIHGMACAAVSLKGSTTSTPRPWEEWIKPFTIEKKEEGEEVWKKDDADLSALWLGSRLRPRTSAQRIASVTPRVEDQVWVAMHALVLGLSIGAKVSRRLNQPGRLSTSCPLWSAVVHLDRDKLNNTEPNLSYSPGLRPLGSCRVNVGVSRRRGMGSIFIQWGVKAPLVPKEFRVYCSVPRDDAYEDRCWWLVLRTMATWEHDHGLQHETRTDSPSLMVLPYSAEEKKLVNYTLDDPVAIPATILR